MSNKIKCAITGLFLMALSTMALATPTSPPTWDSFLKTISDNFQSDPLGFWNVMLFVGVLGVGWIVINAKKLKISEFVLLFLTLLGVMFTETFILMPLSFKCAVSAIILFLGVLNIYRLVGELLEDTSANNRRTCNA